MIINNLDRIIENIEFARITISEFNIVKFVAVSKYADTSSILEVLNFGHRAFGENKIQDYCQKKEELKDKPIEWHFIGSLQKNKINKLIENKPFLFQSLDSLELAKKLNDRLEVQGERLNSLIQINTSNESTKSGFSKNEAIDMYLEIRQKYKNINLKGVMCIGANSDNESKVAESFTKTKEIFDLLKKENATICSMGMSKDYELAIKCGSNLIRVGSEIFGFNKKN